MACGYPVEFQPPFALDAASVRLILGQTTGLPLPANTPIIWPFLKDETRQPLAARLPAGKRSLTLPADIADSLGETVEEGDQLDFIGTFSASSTADSAILPLLQKIQVIDATNQALISGDQQQKKIVVALSPEQALLLLQAAERGKVRALLRGKADQAQLRMPSLGRLKQFLGELPRLSPGKAEVEIVRRPVSPPQ